jgi:hypothetical protein
MVTKDHEGKELWRKSKSGSHEGRKKGQEMNPISWIPVLLVPKLCLGM